MQNLLSPFSSSITKGNKFTAEKPNQRFRLEV